MTKSAANLLVLCTLLFASKFTFADVLEADIDNAIRTACHGNLVDPDDSDFFKFFNIDSPVCKRLQDQGDDFDIGYARQQYKGRITQEDLNRIYDPSYKLRPSISKIEQECTYNEPGNVGVDSHCTKIREDLAAQSIDMSLQQYERLDNACHRDRDCIKQHAQKWQSNQPSYPPKKKVGGLNFDDLMGGNTPATTPAPNRAPPPANNLFSEPSTTATSTAAPIAVPQPAAQQIGFDSLQTHSTKADPTKGEIGFDNIYANRETIRINGIKQTLFDKNEVIASRCQCAFNQTSCFTSDRFSNGQLNEAMGKVDVNYENEMDQMCMTWVDLLQGKTSDDEQQLNVFINNADIIARNLDKLHSGYQTKKETLQDKQAEINYAIRRQEEQRRQQEQQNSGFNWGKFAGLAAGVAIGAGMGDLGGAETMELMGRITMDSMEGVEGVDNLNAGLENITQTYNEHYAAMDDIQRQTNQMNALNEANHLAKQQAQQNQRAQQAQQYSQYQQQPALAVTSDYNDLLGTSNTAESTSSGQGVVYGKNIYRAEDNKATNASTQSAQAPNTTETKPTQQDLSANAVGAYIDSHPHWKTCVVLQAGGTAYYAHQTLENWNAPHSAYVWNQQLSGTWTINGDMVNVVVSGHFVNPTEGTREEKNYDFTVKLSGNKLGRDSTRIGSSLADCHAY